MDSVNKASIEELGWKAVRKSFLSVNPVLGKIIDDVDTDPSFTFFKLSYPFGTEILKNGILQIPNKEGELVSFYDTQISPEIREKLGYNYGSNPVTMAIKNSTELFMQLGQRIIPLYGAIPPGKVFGLWRILNPDTSDNPTFIWGMTSGARSLFMLPNEFIWDMVFSAIQETKNIRPEPYFTNTVRHLFAIGIGALPGFAPAINNEAAPIQKIQKVYQDIYNLDYAPIIMQPTLFSASIPNRPVYYSLEFPTTISAPIKNKNVVNKIINLLQIQHILEKIRLEILHGKLNLEHTTYYKLLQKVKYDFFHSDPKDHSQILSSSQIPMDDPLLLTTFGHNNNLPFPEDCPFVRGCIRIAVNQQEKDVG